ncbi:MAG: twin-arginine translocase subunit TatC [Bacteroidetes bacterium HGW-Bacteroidetes-21]|jgi:sec-independent protein translocase protein TatC|nr:MAG: twin-arginine translocase subunit TatC [Bacteroidetes bacterium HGW-Bacteroidetes-21]
MAEVVSFKKKNRDPNPQKEMSFWKHIDELRWVLFRIIIVMVVFSGVAFAYKEIVFDTIILGPRNQDFITYRVLCKLGHFLSMDGLCISSFDLSIVNLTLTGQFMKHISISIYAGVILSSPYILWEFWRFIKPALKPKERRYTNYALLICIFLFLAGVLFSYFVIVPLTVNFLATYVLSDAIKNTISLDSYISTVTTLTLIMGVVFELPIIMYMLARFGIITKGFLKKKRKYAVVIVLIAAAFITPGSDAFSLVLVSLPLYVLFEVSVWVIPKKKAVSENLEEDEESAAD